MYTETEVIVVGRGKVKNGKIFTVRSNRLNASNKTKQECIRTKKRQKKRIINNNNRIL